MKTGFLEFLNKIKGRDDIVGDWAAETVLQTGHPRADTHLDWEICYGDNGPSLAGYDALDSAWSEYSGD